MRWRFLLVGVVSGVVVAFVLGFVENRFVVGVPEYRFYGYPLVWRVSYFLEPGFLSSVFVITNFLVDVLVWVGVSLVVLFLVGLCSE